MPHIKQYEQLPQKPRKKLQTFVLILSAILVVYLGYGAWTQHLAEAPTASMEKLCDTQSGHCKVVLSGGEKFVELIVNPTPIRAGKKMNLEVTVYGITPKSVLISIAPFGGIAAAKDKNIQLRQTGNATYSVRTKLSSKLKNQEDWIVLVRIETNTNNYAIPFTFTSAGKVRTLLETLQSK